MCNSLQLYDVSNLLIVNVLFQKRALVFDYNIKTRESSEYIHYKIIIKSKFSSEGGLLAKSCLKMVCAQKWKA